MKIPDRSNSRRSLYPFHIDHSGFVASIVPSVRISTRSEDVFSRTFLEPGNNKRVLIPLFLIRKLVSERKMSKYLIHGCVLMQPVTLPRSRVMQSHGVKVSIVSSSN